MFPDKGQKMSRLQQASQQASQQQQPQQSFGERVQSTIAEEKAKVEDYIKGDMGNPWWVAGLGAVMSALFIMVVFYLEYVFFDPTTGLIGKNVSSFFVNAHGLFFYFVAWLMIMGAAVCFGLSYTKNESALLYTIVASAILTLVFFLALKNLTDQASSASYWIWVGLSALAPLVLAVWGWWSLRAMRKNATVAKEVIDSMPDGNQKTSAMELNQAYNSRYTASTIMLVANVAGAIGTFAGFWVMSPALTA